MACTYEGLIEIPLEDVMAFVSKYAPASDERTFGVPKVNRANDTLEITFAASDYNNPAGWAEKPSCMKEWEND